MIATFTYTLEQAVRDCGLTMDQWRALASPWQGLVDGFQPEWLGILPTFLDPDDPRPARQQFHAKYVSGWNRCSDKTTITLPYLMMHYPGDPDFPPIAKLQFRDEVVVFYDSAFVAIIQPDGSYEIARLD